MQLLLRIVLALILGYAVGWGVSAAAGFRYAEALNVIDRDGGMAMGLMFVIGPFFGGITALVALAMVVFKELQRRTPGYVETPLSLPLKVVGMLLTLGCVYLMVWFVIEFSGPFQLGQPWKMLLTEGIPVAAALVAAWLVAQRMNVDHGPRSL
jgi:hypothetical protein